MRIFKIYNFLFVVLLLAVLLPFIYDGVTKSPPSKMKIYYSEILDEFLVQDYDKNSKKHIYKTSNGVLLSLEEFMGFLPFKFYKYLIQKGLFPAKYSEYGDVEFIRKNSQIIKITPSDFNQKNLEIFTIFESNPKYLNLNYNEFIIRNSKNSLEFLSLKSLKKDENLSKNFSIALKESGFKFPFINFFNNPTTKKPFDYGVFLQDSSGEIFHLLMLNEKPKVSKTGFKSLGVRFMSVNESLREEIYGVIVDKKGVYLLLNEYKVIKILGSEYDPKAMIFNLDITPLSKTLTITSSDNVVAFRLDDSYSVVERQNFKIGKEMKFIKLKEYIFPFYLEIEPFFSLKFHGYFIKSIFLNVILMAIFMLIKPKFRKNIWLNFGVLAGGIYTFLVGILI